MIVADTNVIAHRYLPGTFTSDAEALIRRDPEWAAPLLWRSEFRNVLATLVRNRRLNLEVAIRIAADAEAFLRGREFAVPSAAVLREARESARSAYDCEFVVLAMALGVPLATTDRQLLRSFPDVARTPAALAG